MSERRAQPSAGKEQSMAQETSRERLDRIFALRKHAFKKDPHPSGETRIERMKRIPVMLRRRREAILAALAADFHGHSRDMGDLLEIIGMFDRTYFNVANVKRWMKPVSKAADPVTMGKSKAWSQYQPKGVVRNTVLWNLNDSKWRSPEGEEVLQYCRRCSRRRPPARRRKPG